MRLRFLPRNIYGHMAVVAAVLQLRLWDFGNLALKWQEGVIYILRNSAQF